MKLSTLSPVAARAAAVTCIVTLTSSTLAGDLNPPPGAIAPTMLRLDQIEPRVVVNNLPGAADAVHVISAPGNYYCTADITAGAGLNGILVTAGDVTLDLNGYTLRGLPGSLNGIIVDAPTPVTFAASGFLKLGDIKGEVTGFGGNGVTVVRGTQVSLSGLSVTGNSGSGISVVTENVSLNFEEIKVTYDKLDASNNGGNGIDITLSPGAGPSSLIAVVIITGLTALGNAGHGVVVRGSGFPPPPPGAVGGDGKADISIFRPTSMANGGDGVRFEFDNTIRPSITMKKARVRHNSGSGVNAVSLTADTLYDFDFNDVDASFNTGGGLVVSGDLVLKGATLSNNGGDGINYLSGIAPRKRKISIESLATASNGGNGASFTWPAGSAPYTLTVRNSSFSSNTLDGLMFRDLDSDDDGLLDFDRVVASNNGGSGLFVRTFDRASPALYKACVASGNGGSGFDQTGGNARYDQCTASNNIVNGFFYNGRSAAIIGDSYESDYGRCVATNNGLDGFSLFADSVVVTDSTSVGNLRDGMRVSAPDASFRNSNSKRNAGNGFFFDGRRTGPVFDSYEVDYGRCVASTNGLDGFKLFADNVVISSSSAISNLGDGFDFAPGEPVEGINISLEQIPGGVYDNGGNGIVVVNGRLSLGGGTISGNTGSGISAANSSLYCSNVTVTENLAGGFVVADAVRLRLVASVVDNNTGNGVTSSSAAGLATGPVTLQRCSLTGNTGTGCSIAGSVGGQVIECEASNNGLVGIEVLTTGFVLTGNVTAANPAGNIVVLLPGNAVGPPVGAATIAVDNNFANPSP